MRVLMLVLMSEGEPYKWFRNVWKKYMKSHPNIDCYFYRGNPNLVTEYVLDDDTLWIRIPDSLPYIFERTVRAFRYFVNTRPNTYSFLFRPNASCVVNFKRYYEMCTSFPTHEFCSAMVGSFPQRNVKEFPSGSGFTLSFDVVKRFARETGLQNVYIDDVTFGHYLQEWNIPIVPSSRYSFEKRYYSPEELADILSNHFHLRFRSEDRVWDAYAMNMVVDRIYSNK
jgi:hypothetical protein